MYQYWCISVCLIGKIYCGNKSNILQYFFLSLKCIFEIKLNIFFSCFFFLQNQIYSICISTLWQFDSWLGKLKGSRENSKQTSWAAGRQLSINVIWKVIYIILPNMVCPIILHFLFLCTVSEMPVNTQVAQCIFLKWRCSYLLNNLRVGNSAIKDWALNWKPYVFRWWCLSQVLGTHSTKIILTYI